MKISTRIIIALVLSLFIIGGVLIGMAYRSMHQEEAFIMQKFEEAVYDARKNELKSETRIVHDILMAKYGVLKEAGETDENIKIALKELIRDVRFFDDNSGYIFIYTHDGTNVILPVNPGMEGKNFNHLQDANGVHMVAGLIKAADNGGGIVEYSWPKRKGEEPEVKFSYGLAFEPYNWTICIGVYVDNIETKMDTIYEITRSQIAGQVRGFILVAFILVIVSIFLNILSVKKYITNPLRRLVTRTDNLASGDGDLTRKLDVDGKDEIAQVSKGINNFIEKIRVLIADSKALSNENLSIADELSATSVSVGRLIEESTCVVNNTAEKAAIIKNEMEISIDEAKVSRGDLDEANSSLKEANIAILNLTEDIKESATTEVELALKIQQLSSETDQVKNILLVIGDIADQTNLLALNAAIEAARAGDHGRGFAVVADEVRKLAERTQKSVVEIDSTISSIVSSILESSDQMTSNSKKVEELSKTAVSVEVQISRLSSIMGGATEMTNKTVASFVQTGDDMGGIIDGVEQINELSSQNARSVKEIASTAEHMNKMTEVLGNKLSEFKT